MRRIVIAGLLVAFVALGCGSDGSSPKSASTSTTASSSTTTSTRAPTGEQTAWREDTARWQQLAPTPIAKGPDAVAEDLAALLRGGDTSEVGQVEVVDVRTGEPLVVVIRESGLADDSTAAVTYEVTLEPGDEGWLVSRARARSTCVRGVDATDPSLCV